MRSAMLLVLLVDASAFMVGVNRIPSARCSSAMVESWYDAKMAADGEAVTAGPPALSPEQAADNPELAKKIAAEQETLDGLRARMDAFPKKEGTMYCARLHTSTAHTSTAHIPAPPTPAPPTYQHRPHQHRPHHTPVCADITKEKVEISENLLAKMMKTAMTAEERAEAEAAEAAKKAAAAAEKQAAADAKKAEAEAAKAKKAEEAAQKKAKAAGVAAEKKVAAEAKKAAAAEAAAAKKAKAAEEKQRKADEAVAKKVAKLVR
jgi:hypothetical protein